MNIWTPTKVGNLGIKNRLAMAPMTRSRANPDGTPTPLAAEYYSQRAGLGLLVAEGTQPSAEGQGYIFTPGIYTDAHVEGWKQITSAVHAASSRLFIQLMHVGRVSHPDNTPGHIQASRAVGGRAQGSDVHPGRDDAYPRAARHDPRGHRPHRS